MTTFTVAEDHLPALAMGRMLPPLFVLDVVGPLSLQEADYEDQRHNQRSHCKGFIVLKEI